MSLRFYSDVSHYYFRERLMAMVSSSILVTTSRKLLTNADLLKKLRLSISTRMDGVEREYHVPTYHSILHFPSNTFVTIQW